MHTDIDRKTLASRILANALGCRSVAKMLELTIECVLSEYPDKIRHWKAIGPGHVSSTDPAKIACWIQTGVCTVVNIMDGRRYEPHMDDVYAGFEKFVLERSERSGDRSLLQEAVRSGMGGQSSLIALKYIITGS